MMRNMTCSDVQSRLSAFQDRELEASLREDMRRHLESCPECARELELLEAVTTTVRSLPQDEARPSFNALVMSRIQEKEKKRQFSFMPSFVYSFVVIACFGLGILLNTAAQNSTNGQTVAERNGDTLTQLMYQSQTLSLSQVQESSLEILLAQEDTNDETS